MKQTVSYHPASGWVGWFVLLLGLFLVLSTILTAASALTPTTIWYVLVPGTAIGLLLAATGALGVAISRELRERPDARALVRSIVTGLASGSSLGTATGAALGLIALGVSVGMIVGAVSGMAMWVAGRRLNNRRIGK